MSNDESGINLDLHEVEVFLRGDKHNFPLSFEITFKRSNVKTKMDNSSNFESFSEHMNFTCSI